MIGPSLMKYLPRSMLGAVLKASPAQIERRRNHVSGSNVSTSLSRPPIKGRVPNWSRSTQARISNLDVRAIVARFRRVYALAPRCADVSTAVQEGDCRSRAGQVPLVSWFYAQPSNRRAGQDSSINLPGLADAAVAAFLGILPSRGEGRVEAGSARENSPLPRPGPCDPVTRRRPY